MSDRLNKVLTSQLARFMSNKGHPNLILYVDEKNLKVWHFMVVGLDPPCSGEYIFTLTAPDDFPQRPPSFTFTTPNGVFAPGGPICTSIGEDHVNDLKADGSGGWRASLGMAGFAEQVVNGIINYKFLGQGRGIVAIPRPSEMEQFSQVSRSFNLKFDVGKQFDRIITSGENEHLLGVSSALAARKKKDAAPGATDTEIADVKQAATSSERAAASGKQAAANGKQAAASGKQAATNSERAAAGGKQAAASSERAATNSERAAASGKQTAASGKQTAASGKQAATSSERAAAGSERAAASSKRAATSSERAAASSERAAASGKQAAASSERVATSSEQAAAEPEPADNVGLGLVGIDDILDLF